jgi:hypothetical protein
MRDLVRVASFPTGRLWKLQSTCVTPTFYKNKIFVHIGVHIKCISNCSAHEKLSKNKSCIGCIAWHGILYFSKILEEPRRI